MVLPHSHDLRRRMKKGDCALARASEEATRPSTNGGRSCVSPPSRSVPILHTASAKSPNQPRFSAGFGRVCRNCTCTLFLPPNDRQISLPERAPRTASPLVRHRSVRIEKRHRRCSMSPRMSVGLWGSFDAGGLPCHTKRRTQSRRGHPCRPQ